MGFEMKVFTLWQLRTVGVLKYQSRFQKFIKFTFRSGSFLLFLYFMKIRTLKDIFINFNFYFQNNISLKKTINSYI
jgi:hypothetical protein